MSKIQKKTNPIVELCLCIFLGYLGVHRFYTGKVKSGVLYLFTGGIGGIGGCGFALRFGSGFRL